MLGFLLESCFYGKLRAIRQRSVNHVCGNNVFKTQTYGHSTCAIQHQTTANAEQNSVFTFIRVIIVVIVIVRPYFH